MRRSTRLSQKTSGEGGKGEEEAEAEEEEEGKDDDTVEDVDNDSDSDSDFDSDDIHAHVRRHQKDLVWMLAVLSTPIVLIVVWMIVFSKTG